MPEPRPQRPPTSAGDRTLDRCLGAPMPLPRFLRLARSLALAVADIHERGLVHRGLTPAHVVVGDDDAVQVRGFELAAAAADLQAAGNPTVVVGSLPYVAPEQTGRMNRPVDARADLYALGVVFYQMLTGRLPFAGADPLEWVYAHLAREPLPPADLVEGLPAVVSDLVLKLLAKSADDRYQTAQGLAHDLGRCLDLLQPGGHLPAFALGERDSSDRFRLPRRLYGREAELAALQACLARVGTVGRPQLVLVSGPAGMGKTTLVRELTRNIARARGLFAAGKFDPIRRDVPYAPFLQALRELVQGVLSESEAAVAVWRQRLQAALGGHGRLVVDLLPQLELVVGPQPEVPPLPPADAVQRCHAVFARCLAAFARPEHPLVVLLDDVQWADEASLALLQRLVTDAETGDLLLVASVRTGDPGVVAPVEEVAAAVGKAGALVTEIALGPLDPDAVGRLLVEAVRRPARDVAPLALLVHAKTGGNPFFLQQFLTTLHRDGLLAFDRARAAWQWDLSRIETMALTDNVVDLLLARLQRLPAPTLEVLELAACLGGEGDLDELAALRGPAADTAGDLRRAMDEGLMLRQQGRYQFAHDRVQQAAYSLVAEADRPALHARIGRLLRDRTPGARLQERVFDIAGHLNRGAALLLERDERRRAAELDLLAGTKARAAAAYASALEFLEAGCALLDETAWATDYDFAFRLHLQHAQCAWLAARFDTADAALAALLRHAATPVDEAQVQVLAIQLCETRGDAERAIATGVQALARFGVTVEPRPTPAQAQTCLEALQALLRGRDIEDLVHQPLLADPDLQAVADILGAMFPSAHYTDPDLALQLACRLALIGVEHGHTAGSPMAYASLGVLLGSYRGLWQEGYRFGQMAYDLVQTPPFAANRGRVCLVFGNMIRGWTRPLAGDLPILEEGYAACVEVGDLTWATYCRNHVVTVRLMLGHPLAEVQAEAERALQVARKAGVAWMEDVIGAQLQLVRALRGQTADLGAWTDAGFDEAGFWQRLQREGLGVTRCWCQVFRLQGSVLAGDLPGALAAAEAVRQTAATAVGHLVLAEHAFYEALALVAACDRAPAAQRPDLLARIGGHLERMRGWASQCPANFGARLALVEAELARLQADVLAADAAYERAIRAARDDGFVHVQALALELASRAYAARGLETVAAACWRDAQACYQRWGADAKVAQLDHSRPAGWAAVLAGGGVAAPTAQFDALAVAKSSQAISEEIVLDRLIARLLRVVMEHAGAEVGYLLLVHDGEPRIEAAATADGSVQRLAEPVPPGSLVPAGVVRFVQRTRETVCLQDVAADPRFPEAVQVADRRPKSLLCLPISRQGETIGLIYLEHDHLAGAFTPERLAILAHLASQAAISLENARLYDELESRVRARTRQLTETWEELRRSEQSLVAAQALTQLGNWEWDTRTGKIAWSDELYRIFGLSRGEFAPTYAGFVQLVHPDDRRRIDALWQQAFADGQPVAFDHRIVRPDGVERILHARGAVQMDADGRPILALGTAQDITERKQMEEQLREQYEKLKELDRLKSHFVGSVTHELRNPLTAIKGFLSLLAEGNGAVLPPHQREYVGEALRAEQRLEWLIDDLLDAARIEAGTFRLQRTSARFDDKVRETAESLRPLVRSAGVHLVLEPMAEPLTIEMDGRRIGQVLCNLLGNALKFTPRDGTIRVRAELDGDELRCEVEDTGPGVHAEDVPKLFQRFSQLEEGVRKGGTGLGLSICKTLVEAHGGQIGVRSTPGEGSTFWFTLPRGAPAVPG